MVFLSVDLTQEGMDPLLAEEADYLRSLRILTGDARDQQIGASRVGCTACVCLAQEKPWKTKGEDGEDAIYSGFSP